MSERFNSPLTITVKIQAGANIHETCDELVNLAQRMSAWVEADFNGVKLLVCPRTNRDLLVERYNVRLQDESGYKIASAH